MKQKHYFILLLAVILAGCSINPEKLADIDSEYVAVNDSVRIHYKKYGDGDKAICFVHGFGCSHHNQEGR